MVLRSALTIIDVSAVRPPSANTLSAAAEIVGATAARRDALKQASYSRVEPNGYTIVPFTTESHGRLGVPAMKLLHDLGDEAASPRTHPISLMLVLWRGLCVNLVLDCVVAIVPCTGQVQGFLLM
jgi:hypothetical protein